MRTVDPNSGNIVIAPTDTDGLEITLGDGRTSQCELVYGMDRPLPAPINVLLFPLAAGCGGIA